MLIRRCLQRRLRRRVQHIGDARVVIDEVLNEPELYLYPAGDVAAGVATGAVPEIPHPTASVLARVAPWVVAAVAVVAAAAAIWRGSSPDPSMPPVRTSIMLPADQQLVGRPMPSFAISPDGESLVYVASVSDGNGDHIAIHERQIFVRRMGEFAAEPIPGTEGADSPFFSPDGQWIGFFSSDNKIKKVALSGGAVIELCEVAGSTAGASWGQDGWIVFATRLTNSGLLRVSEEGGEISMLTELDIERGEIEHRWPHHLPDGRGVLYSVETPEGAELNVLSPEGERRTLFRTPGRGVYSRTGHLLYDEADQLRAVPFDLDSLTADGSSVAVVEDLYASATGRTAYFAVGDNGTLLYVPGGTAGQERSLVWVDRWGNREPVIADLGGYAMPRISPDGSRVAVMLSPGSAGDIYEIDIVRGARRRVTTAEHEMFPVLSPDGEEIVFASTRSGPANIWRKRLDGTDEEELVHESEISKWPRSWSPNGDLAYYEVHPETMRDIWVLNLGGLEAQPFIDTDFNERAPMFSPDGGWIAFVSNESGRDEVYVRSYPDGNRQYTISTDGGSEPMWSKDGREIYYRTGDRMMAVRVTLENGDVDTPVQLFTGHYASDAVGNQYYDVGPDGRFLMITAEDEEPPPYFNIVLHWFLELEEAFSAEQ